MRMRSTPVPGALALAFCGLLAACRGGGSDPTAAPDAALVDAAPQDRVGPDAGGIDGGDADDAGWE